MILRRFLLVFAISVLMVNHARADGPLPDRLVVQIGSFHLNLEPPSDADRFEEFNPGFILVWDRGWPVEPAVGYFRNSYGSSSPMIGGAIPLYETDQWSLKGFGAVAYYGSDARHIETGLEEYGLVPFLGAQLQVQNFYVQAAPIMSKSGGLSAVVIYGMSFDF